MKFVAHNAKRCQAGPSSAGRPIDWSFDLLTWENNSDRKGSFCRAHDYQFDIKERERDRERERLIGFEREAILDNDLSE